MNPYTKAQFTAESSKSGTYGNYNGLLVFTSKIFGRALVEARSIDTDTRGFITYCMVRNICERLQKESHQNVAA